MARTIATIKTELGNAYISQSAVKALYGFTDTQVSNGYDALFSTVAPTSLMFYAIAFCINVFEQILDTFKTEVQTTIDAAYIGNDAWWHSILSAFQKGYDLVLNETTFKYGYSTTDTTAQIIKRRAVRQKEDTTDGNKYKVFLYVATETNGEIASLSNDEVTQLESYVMKQKYSGVLTKIVTGDGDTLDINLTVNYNPLLLNSDGELITDGITKPVDVAAESYVTTLNDTAFGGRFNVTKFLDTIQSATGVVDPKITGLSINSVAQSELWGTYESTNGWFKIGTLTVTYQPQTQI